MHNNNKRRIFITSTGRTATQFFAKYLNQIIENSVALHEPGTPWVFKTRQLLTQIRDFGVYHLTIGQGKNTHSMYKLSRDYVAGDITKEQAIKNIKRINGVVENLHNCDVFVYSSGHIYGLIDLLDEAYPDSRFVFVVRDPREWIGSALKKFSYTLYGPVELFFKNLSLQPNCFKDDPYLEKWDTLSKFEKYCWFYNRLNNLALTTMQGRPNFKVFKYEDLFLHEDKNTHFNGLLEFATNFNSGKAPFNNASKYIHKRIDSQQKKEHTNWEKWTTEQAEIMMKHCGKLMDEFGYGKETLWREKLKYQWI